MPKRINTGSQPGGKSSGSEQPADEILTRVDNLLTIDARLEDEILGYESRLPR
jgi:hypothetical protein